MRPLVQAGRRGGSAWRLLLGLLWVCCMLPSSHQRLLKQTHHHLGHQWHEQGCMETHSMAGVLEAAAYHHQQTPAALDRFGPAQSVMLTACNEHCLASLLPPFMENLQHGRDAATDGNVARHLVIVALGEQAYRLCLQQAATYGHQCLLDHFCMPRGKPEGLSQVMGFRSPRYYLALLQKVLWAVEVVDRGFSVVWVDLDIVFLRNPLRFVFEAAPDADLATQVEYWGVDTAFKGSVCVVTESTTGCQPGGPPFVHDESAVDPASGKPICCQNPINGGFWMARANPRGANLLRSWAARLFEDGVVQGKLFTGSAILDQEMLTVLVSSRKFQGMLVTNLYQWDAASAKYLVSGNVTRHTDEIVYRISGQHCSSACSGSLCGWMGPLARFPVHVIRDHEGHEVQHVCVMPRKAWDRLVSYHLNCITDLETKLHRMTAFRNVTIDEAAWLQSGHKVVPDW